MDDVSRRTYQQAVAWRAAAVALLAEVTEAEVTPNPRGDKKTPHDVATGEQKIVLGKGQIMTYLSGKVSIGGSAEDADYLCEPLARHGLLEGWQPGSRGSGVTWTVSGCGARLAYETMAGAFRVHREGRYRFRCTSCGREGENDGRALTCS